jgi:hypothetical protein
MYYYFWQGNKDTYMVLDTMCIPTYVLRNFKSLMRSETISKIFAKNSAIMWGNIYDVCIHLTTFQQQPASYRGWTRCKYILQVL